MTNFEKGLRRMGDISGLVVSIAAFAENDDVRKGIIFSDQVRNETLKRCYAIPGYADLLLEQKNLVYDRIKEVVLAEVEA